MSHKLKSIYVYLSDPAKNTFKGYKIKRDAAVMKLYEVWSINIPSDQKIVKVTNKRSNEVVNSVGRVLGDHTVMYKYLNPNLVSIMSVQGEGMKGSLYIYIVDAVTGTLSLI